MHGFAGEVVRRASIRAGLAFCLGALARARLAARRALNGHDENEFAATLRGSYRLILRSMTITYIIMH